MFGVLTFTNVFIPLRQEQPTSGQYPRPVTNMFSNFDHYYDLWINEMMDTLLEIMIGAVIGLEADLADQATKESGKILFIIAVVLNTIVFMNLLLSVVSSVQGNISELSNQYHYKQKVDRICMLQRVFFWRGKKEDPSSFLFLAKECREYDTGTGVDFELD